MDSQMLLHACCGPCSLEPVRVLRERGIEPHIFYANSNIAPAEEYARRLETLRDWAASEGLSVEEGAYDPSAWQTRVASPWEASAKDEAARKERCRECYRLRLEQAAAWAVEHGYEALGTTLSVSPYQYTDVIREELERACGQTGLTAVFEDWRPYYPEATRRSREAGMYRQNYCGCTYSAAEAQTEREERAAQREAKRAERAQANAEKEAQLEAKREERREYDAKRARQRAVLKELRSQKASS